MAEHDPRIRCSVPGCGRTASAKKMAPWTAWICGNHWSLLSPVRRRNYARIKKKRPEMVPWIWERLERAVIEKAAGL